MKFLLHKSSIKISNAKKIPSIQLNNFFINLLKHELDKTIDMCPHCHSTNIIKYGHFSENKQRYRCKDCRRTFNKVTNSILSYTKKTLNDWVQYLNCMNNKFTIRKSAFQLKISSTTAFYWRHKVLKVLNDNLPNALSGVIEIKTTYINESFKGKRYPDGRRKNICIGKKTNDFSDIKDRRVCVLCCHDNLGNTFAKTLCRGSINYAKVSETLKYKIPSNCEICTDNNMAYVSFAKKNNLRLHKITSINQIIEGKYHIKDAYNFSNKLKTLVSKCRGVCTRYLNFYISWTKWLYKSSKYNSIKNIINILMINKVNFINRDLNSIGELG
ncbi:IS1595 family transposase [Clostridium oryzae]|uniref:ISXO2-like transposase domain-containing protein n=1 Tax=Clostridium oryzae TaxID=1450648 RepID=A0A1V4IJW3_9CLOT|nr:IS1595 family transposase [Clostridium oryzae]OPJ60312.1 hypothetical protein CLORY_28870 [Clostridium oryzae]